MDRNEAESFVRDYGDMWYRDYEMFQDIAMNSRHTRDELEEDFARVRREWAIGKLTGGVE